MAVPATATSGKVNTSKPLRRPGKLRHCPAERRSGVCCWAGPMCRAGTRTKRARKTYVPPTFLAVVYASLGENEKAFQWLDKAYAERDLYMAWIKVDPAFDALRADDRFKNLTKRMKFSP